MSMKDHILAAMREQVDQWEALLAGFSEADLTRPFQPSDWTIKDVLIHLWAWQQRSIARVEAAIQGREPAFPRWVEGSDPDGEGSPDEINAWIYGTYQSQPWAQVHQNWLAGYRHLLESAGHISERDLLDSSQYAWLDGYPLAFILVASYDHHQEHYDKLKAWLSENQLA